MGSVKAGIVGASGYTGGELLRLLAGHPSVEVVWATSRQYAGRPVAEAYPYLRDFVDLAFSEPDLDGMPGGTDGVFVALPHTEAMEAVPLLIGKGLRVVDLSADFRLSDPDVYSSWYGHPHTAPELLREAVYGLTEWNRERIAGARLVANPGCYPTAALLALLPLVKRNLVGEGEIVIDAKSGVSGAGRAPKQSSLYCEVSEGVTPYAVGRHRHIPEMEQELARAAGQRVGFTFAPHLMPLSRGMLETIYLRLSPGAGGEEVAAAYGEDYGNEPFVKVSPPGVLPSLREASGTNLCRIGYTSDREGGRTVVVSVIDNLVKGASGQALQNFNLMLGLPETDGLGGPGHYP